MTKEREKEIRQYLKERNIPITSLEANSIIEGIEWADRNSKEATGKELLYVTEKTVERTKKELINKACEWIEDYKHLYKVLSSGSLSTDWDKFIREFRKAMEE